MTGGWVTIWRKQKAKRASWQRSVVTWRREKYTVWNGTEASVSAADIGPLWPAHWGALTLPGSTRTAHALSLWQALCAGDGVGLPRSIATNLNFQVQQASLVSSHYGANNGPPHSRMFKDSISIGARPLATLSSGVRPKGSAAERKYNGRLWRRFHRLLPFKLWIRDESQIPLFMRLTSKEKKKAPLALWRMNVASLESLWQLYRFLFSCLQIIFALLWESLPWIINYDLYICRKHLARCLLPVVKHF